MSEYRTDDLRIRGIEELIPPSALLREHPATLDAANTVSYTRHAVHRVLHGADDRLVVLAGPCPILEADVLRASAEMLLEAKRRRGGDLLVSMLIHFRPPHEASGSSAAATPGASVAINEGLRSARERMLRLNESGLAIGCELIDMITPQYVGDLISWAAIGARATESQVHRELASGLSCPVGFKNGSDGNVKIAVDALRAAHAPHHFMGVTKGGHSAIVATTGNEDCHIVLSGGSKPNYDAPSVDAACTALGEAGLAKKLMIDLAQANAAEPAAGADVARQVAAGDERIAGVLASCHPDAQPQLEALLERLAGAVEERRLRKARDC